jgi:hypothetical protein
LKISQGYIIRILQHFATKLGNITNFVMLFHAMMEVCLDLLRSKFWLSGEWSIGEKLNKQNKLESSDERTFITRLLVHIHQKKKIPLEIAAKTAGV